MAYQRYDGVHNGAIQNFVDKKFPTCPFCGESPHWLLDCHNGNIITAICMCEKCNGKLYLENRGFHMENVVQVVDVGDKNVNNLALNASYNIQVLQSIADKNKVCNTTATEGAISTGSTSTATNSSKTLKNVLTFAGFVLIALALIWLIASIPSWINSKSNSIQNGVVYIGETVKNSNGINFTVVSVENTQDIGYNERTENNYMIITIRISNNGSETWKQNPNNCILIKNGTTFEYNSNTYLLENGMSSFDEINPGITKTLRILFETPTKSTEEEYSVKLKGYSMFKDDSVTILLKNRV